MDDQRRIIQMYTCIKYIRIIKKKQTSKHAKTIRNDFKRKTKALRSLIDEYICFCSVRLLDKIKIF